MAEDTKPAETPPAEPKQVSNTEALATAGAFFSTVEKYLVQKQQDAADLPAHSEYSSLRGLMEETLRVFRAGKPGGN